MVDIYVCLCIVVYNQIVYEINKMRQNCFCLSYTVRCVRLYINSELAHIKVLCTPTQGLYPLHTYHTCCIHLFTHTHTYKMFLSTRLLYT